MSKRDYIAIAKLIQQNRTATEKHPELAMSNWARLVCDLGDYFASKNEAFDKGLWHTACKVKE